MRTITVERRYLTLPTPSAFQPRRGEGVAPDRSDVALRRLAPDDLAGWRRLYHMVGAPWLWVDRNAWSDEQLASYLARPGVAVWAVDAVPAAPVDGSRGSDGLSADAVATRDVGMLELASHDDGSVEIVYLGLVAAYHGRGLGAWLLQEAVALAWQRGATRVWLHTCSLDAPAALPNYLARGFVLERTEQYTVTLDDLSPSPPDVAS